MAKFTVAKQYVGFAIYDNAADKLIYVSQSGDNFSRPGSPTDRSQPDAASCSGRLGSPKAAEPD